MVRRAPRCREDLRQALFDYLACDRVAARKKPAKVAILSSSLGGYAQCLPLAVTSMPRHGSPVSPLQGMLLCLAGERRTELAGASIVVPLISPSFIGSRYCAMDELLAALQGGKRLVPVLIQHVDLQALPITAIQCLPNDERQDLKPLAAWRNPDQALAAIAAAIREAVAEFEVQAIPAALPAAGRASAGPQPARASGRALSAPWLIGAALAALVAVAAIGLLVSGDTNVTAIGGVAAGRDASGNKVIHNGTKP